MLRYQCLFFYCMKRILLAITLLAMVAVVQAKPVDPTVLLRAAQRVLNRTDVVDATPSSFTYCRLYTGADGIGFVLLSADDCARPLLGYSTDESFPAEGLPEHIMAWIDAYQRDISVAVAEGVTQSQRAADEWQWLMGARCKAVATAAGPFLTTKWGQGYPYNEMCPYDSLAGSRCLTGCVATAAAQLLRYWGHPEVGRGEFSYVHKKYGTLTALYDTTHYRWDRMPNSLSMSSQNRIDAVSLLMYHVGVGVEMDYGVNGSGGYSNSLGNIVRGSNETSLKEHFRYNPALFAGYKEGYTDAEWRAMIDHDLDNARPILYDGYGAAGGHAFVLDGRDTMGLYHFNWGWDGQVNGYFTLDSLVPAANTSFSQLNSAIFHIYPIELNESTATIVGVSSDPTRGTVSGSGTYSVDTLRVILLATAAPGFRFDHWTSGNPANPIITSPTNNLSDTAVFVPLHRDTVGYCRPNGIAYKNLTGGDTLEWGIRLPASYLEGKQRLREVQFWTYEDSGPYDMEIYRGELPNQLVYSDVFTSTGYGMHTIAIDSTAPIDLADTMPIWIVFRNVGYGYPMSYSHFTGTADGSWVKYQGQWSPIYEVLPFYSSWMIRAVIDPPMHVGIAQAADDIALSVNVVGRTVSVEADAPVALYDTQGRCLAACNGSLRCTVSAAGIYIVRAGTATQKIVVF